MRALRVALSYVLTVVAYGALLGGCWLLGGLGATLLAVAAITSLEVTVGHPRDPKPRDWTDRWRSLRWAVFWIRHVMWEDRQERRARAERGGKV